MSGAAKSVTSLLDPTALFTGIVGSALMSALAPKKQDPTPAPTPAAPPAKQAETVADQSAVRASASTPQSGNASTFLTGPGGVPTSSLNLGRNTFFGQ